jgi:hypothetical protein
MRRKMFLTVVTIGIVTLFAFAPLAGAGTKHCKGSAKLVGKPSETILNIDDNVPEHKMRLRIMVYDHTCDCEEIAEFRQYTQDYADVVGGSAQSSGYYTSYIEKGGATFGKWNGSSKTEMKKDGSWEIIFSGNWEQTGGKGKFQGMKGGGTYVGKASPSGFSYEWEGDMEFPD